MKRPKILAIDTSCDETCAAVSCGRKILSNVISSQINIHQEYGGVVPHLAKRAHQDKIAWVVKEALQRAKLTRQIQILPAQSDSVHEQAKFRIAESLSAVAVTIGPGLAPALEVGIAFAKKLALKYEKPLIAVNHMEGHLLSSLAKPNPPEVKSASWRTTSEVDFPALGLLASGGHTQLVLVKSIGNYELLGETLDDAAGEALDKLAQMLKLGYPGGPIIEQLAKLGNPDAINLPIPMQHSQDLNFSFSGLKTAALYIIQKKGSELLESSEPRFAYNMCAAFQQAIAKSLIIKLSKALAIYQPKSLLLGGGVFANLYFRAQIRSMAKQHALPLYFPYSKKLFTDNAAMIAVAAFFRFNKGESFVKDIQALDRQPNLNF
ncbi:MAG: putative tRNA threonylcarbamoyladenosine biosynthesis protein Gcp [Candidatus Beckwithbacteria bacterium GW2011_GWA2_43_10]|uniref:tRNA N6-adenosine threonylcarbamoyltransferase n=1 Tax=Candidatus Beckwithbacteria bacterium GW2011_GWA2_43_10 TaxID=1618369 RepID=A0A0G1E7Z8_9BACT|nr:MAG: putative tRNA threonylcarbamoyladenosine biosynthesis protein Gcp [Candidatus Beckwithbacteria bacterium GW2011_GWA2_43_10]